jgi:hypothetical protein
MSIKEMLKNEVLAVTFQKANGDIRVMICTTREDLVGIKTYSNKPGPEHLCTVWDLEAEGWRSFKIDSVMNIGVLEWSAS